MAKAKKIAWREWVNHGRNRGNDPDFIKCKYTKTEFRKQQKEVEKEWEISQMENIQQSHQIDQKQFWNLANKRKQKSGRLHLLKLDNGIIVTNPEEQRKEWESISKICIHT